MATPHRITLINPRRVWLAITILAMTILVGGFVLVDSAQRNANQSLVESQTDILIRSRIADLYQGRFRDFVEGIGREFSNLEIHIRSNGKEFKSAPISASLGSAKYCAIRTTTDIGVEICRPLKSSALPFAILICLFGLVAAAFYLILWRMEKRAVAGILHSIADLGIQVSETKGLMGLMGRIKGIKAELDSARKREIELKRSKALAEFALEVAHNLRSPLTLLDNVAEQVADIQETKRDLLTMAIARVRDVGTSLIERSERFLANSGKSNTKRSGCQRAFGEIIETVIAEKRVQYGHITNLAVRSIIPGWAAGISVVADQRELHSILSNLIDNSIQAINKEKGLCEVRVERKVDEGRVELSVADNGRGIPPEVLRELPKRGLSYGKTKGFGLGLYSAKQKLRKLRGNLQIRSEQGRGTTVTISLPYQFCAS